MNNAENLEGLPVVAVKEFEGVFGISTSTKIEKLGGGWSNTLWRLDTPHGTYVLKIYASDIEKERIQGALDFAQHLVTCGTPAIVPMRTRSGARVYNLRGRLATLHPFIEGITYRLDAPVPIEVIGSAARCLAQLHEAGRTFPRLLPSTAMLDANQALEIYYAVEKVIRELPHPEAFDLECARAINAKISLLKHENFTWDDLAHLPHTNIHGDYHQGNLIVSTSGDITSILDLDCCAYQPRIWEILLALSRLCISMSGEAFLSPLNLKKVGEFLHAYALVSRLTEEEIHWLPRLGWQAALQSTFYLECYYLKRYALRSTLLPPLSYAAWFWWDLHYPELESLIVESTK